MSPSLRDGDGLGDGDEITRHGDGVIDEALDGDALLCRNWRFR